jgi:hypothetical protein
MIVMLVALLASLFFVAVPVDAAYSWVSLDGATIDSPAVAGVYGRRVDVVVRGTNNEIYHKYWTSTGGWSGWIDLHGQTSDKPAVAYTLYNLSPPGHKDLFHVVVRGMDNKIYHKKFDLTDNTWDTSWSVVEPPTIPWTTSSTPALTTIWDSNDWYLFCLVRGQDNKLYYAMYDGWDQYWGWYAGASWLNGQTKDDPAVATYKNKIEVVVRGMNDGVYHQSGTPMGGWIQWSSSWEALPGTTTAAPTLWANDYYGPHVFVRGSNNAIYWWEFYSDRTWWISLGGATNDRPVFWIEPESIYRGDWCLFVRGTNNVVYRKFRVWNYDYGTYEWEAVWTPTNGQTLSAPAIDNYCLVVRGSNNNLYRLTNLWG